MLLITDRKVKSSKLKARFHSMVLTFKQSEDSAALLPTFVYYNEWCGDLPKQEPPSKKLKFVCLGQTPD